MKILLIFLCFVALASAGKIKIDGFMRPTGVERFKNVLKAVEHSRIVGGVESVPHSHPYQVGLFLTTNSGTFFCGGSLISTKYVMTAAHCVFDGIHIVRMWTIVMGAHNIYDEENSVRMQSTKAIMHPNWIPYVLINDIALVELPIEAPLSDKIQPIVLPPYSAVDIDFTNATSIVSGWGKAADDINQISETLREVSVPILKQETCALMYLGVVQSTHICTNGADGKGSCNGDSGGPLTAVVDGQKIQIGIVSFGVSLGCEVGWPPVYTRVTSYLDWISETAGIEIKP